MEGAGDNDDDDGAGGGGDDDDDSGGGGDDDDDDDEDDDDDDDDDDDNDDDDDDDDDDDEFSARWQVLWLTPPGDEMNEAISRCLLHRQLMVCNLSKVAMCLPKWGSTLRPFERL